MRFCSELIGNIQADREMAGLPQEFRAHFAESFPRPDKRAPPWKTAFFPPRWHPPTGQRNIRPPPLKHRPQRHAFPRSRGGNRQPRGRPSPRSNPHCAPSLLPRAEETPKDSRYTPRCREREALSQAPFPKAPSNPRSPFPPARTPAFGEQTFGSPPKGNTAPRTDARIGNYRCRSPHPFLLLSSIRKPGR